MDIAAHYIVYQTDHWIINHHQRSALPGYLILSTKTRLSNLAELVPAALAELGILLAKTQQILERQLVLKHLYISRFGHEPGWPIHFHFIPVYQWVEDLFWKDARYRVLETFSSIESTGLLTDGAELTLYIWREFGESPNPPSIQGPSINEVIHDLRLAFRGSINA